MANDGMGSETQTHRDGQDGAVHPHVHHQGAEHGHSAHGAAGHVQHGHDGGGAAGGSAGRSHSGGTGGPAAAAENGAHIGNRKDVPWSPEIWKRLDKAVHDEMLRTRIAQKFFPVQKVDARVTSVPSEVITYQADPNGAKKNLELITIDEGATQRLYEFWTEFTLTAQQVEHETGDVHQLGHSAAVTLATRAANQLALAEDLVVFQGAHAQSTAFWKKRVSLRAPLQDIGLMGYPVGGQENSILQADQIIKVKPRVAASQPPEWGENTFRAVAKGYSELQGAGQGGPYAMVLETGPYSDTFSPFPNTLICTADRIRPLMEAGFHGSHALNRSGGAAKAGTVHNGVIVSLGGNSMDLVMGLDATVTFGQIDTEGNYRFRVVERFALRIKDPGAIIRLEFETK